MRFNKLFKILVLSLTIVSVLFILSCGDTQTSNNLAYNQSQESSSEETFAASSTDAPYSDAPQYKEGEILVKFKHDKKGLKAASMRGVVGARLKRRFDFIEVEHVELPPGLAVKDAIKLYMDNPDVEYAEPNYIVRKAVIPAEQYFGLQWGMHNTGQTIAGDQGTKAGTTDADIDGPEAWDIHTGLGNVVVAVIDTGVDYKHPDLSANMWQNPAECAASNATNVDDDGNGFIDDCRGWDFANGINDPMDDDVDGHGTHVAGIIGAIGNNGTGVSGVNWAVNIMPLKFLGADGRGLVSDAIEAILYAKDMKKNHSVNIRAINASYAGPELSTPERDAINAAGAEGILFMAAAGNDLTNNDTTPTYPASHNLPTEIAVAASNQKDERAWFSNYGSTTVQVLAPGENIVSTIRTDLVGVKTGVLGYGFMSGTSMASPHVAGLVALISSYNPSLTVAQIKETILSTVDYKNAFNTYALTEGRINAHRALLLANAPEAIILPPTNTAASFPGGPNVDVTWTDNSTNENGFVVQRKACSNGFYGDLVPPAGGSPYTDFGPFSEGTTYFYRVIAANSFYASESNMGRSSPSKGASVTAPITITAPSGLIANTVPGRIDLTWEDNSSNETGFRVQRSTSPSSGFGTIGTVGANVTSFGDTAFQSGVTYYYRVRAYKTICSADNNSDFSNTASVGAVGATATGGGSGGGGGCFIATAAYGSYLSPEVRVLRDFRDRHLLTNPVGRAFVGLYYRTSPPIADYIAKHETLRLATRLALTPVVYGVKHPLMALIFAGAFVPFFKRRRKPINP